MRSTAWLGDSGGAGTGQVSAEALTDPRDEVLVDPGGRVPPRGVSDLARHFPVSRALAGGGDVAPASRAADLPSAPMAAPSHVDVRADLRVPRT